MTEIQNPSFTHKESRIRNSQRRIEKSKTVLDSLTSADVETTISETREMKTPIAARHNISLSVFLENRLFIACLTNFLNGKL